MVTSRNRLNSPEDTVPVTFTGVGVVLMTDTRDLGVLLERPPEETIHALNRVASSVVSAVEKHGGKIHQQIAGATVAYWSPSVGSNSFSNAIEAAREAVKACGGSVAASVAIGDLALTLTPTKQALLLGGAYQRAEKTLRIARAGAVAVDLSTYSSLSPEERDKFVQRDDRMELGKW